MFEIAGGIILAVLVFYFLPLIIAGGVLLVAVAVVVLLGVFAYSYFHQTLVGLSWIFLIAVSFGTPAVLFHLATKRYPKYEAAIDGKPPFDGLRMLPIRMVATGITAVGGVLLAAVVVAYLGTYLDAYLK
ncbi:MAG: hypothetical protein PHS32_20685 [Rhodoferax sp.]|uniref:hypothetical protein n=1 Tax=Rhodoferax sp. TaxID=50421 RepID=UPI0026332EE5|nr:hypothetical protein [Rhodoferax sp.]MDD5336160.1 hypothetical protein [Rhodoferax sp.]